MGWVWLALGLVVVGTGGSVVVARVVAGDRVQGARAAFRLSTSEIASTLRLALQREEDLVASAQAFVIEHPHVSNAEFARWVRDQRVLRRYPELLGMTEVVVVPAGQLAAFEARELADPPAGVTHSTSYSVVPSGQRPFYCLSAVSFDRPPPVPLGLDWCLSTPSVLADRDGGHGSAYTIRLAAGMPNALGLQYPVYRGGVVPASVSARRRAFVGLIGMGITPQRLLGAALAGHRGVAAVLQRSGDASPGSIPGAGAPRFTVGIISPHAERLVSDLYDGARLTTFTRSPAGGVLDGAGSAAVLLGGGLVSWLLGLLVVVLATGRARALRLVDERTRALSIQADRQARLLETQRELTAITDRGTAQRLICDRARELSGADGASVWIVEENHVHRAAIAGDTHLIGSTLPLGDPLVARALRQGGSGVVDLETDVEPDSAHGWRCGLGVPLAHGARKLGLVQLLSARTGAFDETDRQALGLLAVMLSEFHSRVAESEALARFEAVYRDAPIGIGIIDLDGRYTQTTNQRLHAIYGVGEPAGIAAVEFVDEADRTLVAGEFRRLLVGERDTCVLEHRLEPSFDGRQAFVQLSMSLVRDAAGNASFVVAMIDDVTEHKLAELERARHEVQTRMHQKLEAVGQLAAGIAHEMNTPIQFVGDSVRFVDDSVKDLLAVLETYREVLPNIDSQTHARIAQAEAEADLEYLLERIPQVFERIYTGVERVATLVRAMKDFAHSNQVEKAPADINEAINTTLTVARNEYKYIADVQLELGELPQLVCNISDLNQVFLNLIVNAAHAIQDANADQPDTRGTITIRTYPEPNAVVIEIADNGTGIAHEIKDRIFDPFFTTKEQGRGTGQGLAIAYGIIVDRHGGTLELQTEVGIGTTFVIRLPHQSSAAGQQLTQAA